ncbi:MULTISPECIES: hypothetical protein [Streptomyces]|uniref:Uncharacterized protein n=1 Tax=Streptomyces fradiae ATCC 10745 = DSM 40063 TaxID=1319510 RepID=A0A1Y2NSH0_STRFR|nr:MULTISPECIES: hypothetical protein [Streptomyces]KAF0649185.1 hypothetical protein K701_13835 [Streptomyces fradiae ATCC 10745 = DSM 40063]OSY50280.1 hypothetical protein BG846_04101 [Streptomyces fradiae ATCC 10745 = DSM 40063]
MSEPQTREPVRADDPRAQDAINYARAQEHRAWQTNRDQINHGAETTPAHFAR